MLYLHWTDIIDKDKVPWLFNLYGQEFRDQYLMEDEKAMFVNELNAMKTLYEKINKLFDPDKLFLESLDGWKVAGVDEENLQRTLKAYEYFLKHKDELKPDENPPWANGDLDALID